MDISAVARAWVLPLRRGLLAMLLAVAGCGGGDGDGLDDADWLFPLWVPTDVSVVDLDEDGRADILTLAQYASSASQREGRLIVHRQLAAGSFTTAEMYVVGLYPWRLATDDIDGDGRPDAVVVDVDGGAVFLLPQDPASPGRLLAPRLIASTPEPHDLAIADLNADSAPDLAIASSLRDSRRLVLLYQDPGQRGSFRPATDFPVPGSSCTGVAAGDLDGDGRADLFMAIAQARDGNTPNLTLGVSLQRPDGSLGAVTTFAPQRGLNAARLSVGDYDGDGRSDLLAYFTPFSAEFRAQLSVVTQASTPGSFLASVDTKLTDIRGLDDAVFADLGGDGRPEAVLVGFFPTGSPSTVQARANFFVPSGGGEFALAESRELSVHASRVAAGDVDGDGRNELVALGDQDRFVVMD